MTHQQAAIQEAGHLTLFTAAVEVFPNLLDARERELAFVWLLLMCGVPWWGPVAARGQDRIRVLMAEVWVALDEVPS